MTIPILQLSQFEHYPPITQKLITKALGMAALGLTYTYGSANPKSGGMDCSGTINYLLLGMGVKNVPRDANGLYEWTVAQGHFYPVKSNSFSSPEFNELRPGDLLFWSGTYVTKSNALVTHVMLYLGINLDGKPLMFGSSNGRTYEGIQRWGVSVFDFNLPSATSTSHFLGFSCIPTLTCGV
ncbi:MAG: C40 family peptidase [Gammaproteobacteria bacterium]|nr:C40 family peptidase [Gammaproteobacteria bacterium]